MFAEIQFTPIKIEVLLADYLIRGELRSRGDIVIFLNDRNYPAFSLNDCEIHPLSADRRVGIVRQDRVTVDKTKVNAVSVRDTQAVEQAQLPVTSRKVIIYCSQFVFHGSFHVQADAPDEDIFDETRDFFGLTSGSIYPLVPVGTEPHSSSPLILINRLSVQAYSIQKK